VKRVSECSPPRSRLVELMACSKTRTILITIPSETFSPRLSPVWLPIASSMGLDRSLEGGTGVPTVVVGAASLEEVWETLPPAVLSQPRQRKHMIQSAPDPAVAPALGAHHRTIAAAAGALQANGAAAAQLPLEGSLRWG
jgi:hypothetical protein